VGAFIGYGEVGVWASNRERDAFLDCFAEHRCSPGDSGWEYCRPVAQGWTGRRIDLEDLIPAGQPVGLTKEEYSQAADFRPDVAQLLDIIEAITRGEWQIRVDGRASIDGRRNA
jgi:hypothetical protein